MLIENARFVVTQNTKREILENVSIRISGNALVEIGQLERKDGEEVIDANHSLVLPGLVNCHTHLGMSLLRGLSDDKELPEWLGDIISAEKKLSNEDIFQGALHGCKESLRFGTTTVFDMYHTSEPSTKAAAASGIRAIMCSDYFNAFPEKQTDDSIDYEWQREYDNHPLVSIGYGPHSIYGVAGDMLKAISTKAKESKRLMMLHLAETRKERYDCMEKHGLLPLQYLDSLGVLGPHLCLVHNIWLTKEEIRTIGKTQTKCIHCPTSNMKLAGGGTFALREMHEAGVIVGLGTDSTGSNNNLDMFTEMKIAALLHKHHYWDPTIANAQVVLDMATIDGARVLGMEKDIGSLELGKKADLIIIPIKQHMEPALKERMVSHVVYSINGSDVGTVIVDGQVRVRDGQVL